MAAPTPTLIVIDVQRALDDPRYGERSNPDAERNIARAIEGWRDRRAPDGELIPAETMQRTAIASLNEEFAEVLGTDEALARAFGG